MLSEALRREVRRLRVRTRRRVESLFAGEYLSAFKGRGIEFAEVREYEPGDDVRTIDWNVSARTGRTHIKRFIEERELTLFLLVDASASGDFASVGTPKRRLAAEVAATLAFSAARNNDRVGLVVFTDRIERFIPPRKGGRHALRLAGELLSAEPVGRGTDLGAAIDFLARVQRRRALVFVVSDFLTDTPDLSLRLLSRRHEVIALRIGDPREKEVPAIGLVRAFDPEAGRERLVDLTPARARRYAGLRREHDLRVAGALSRARIDRVDLSTDRPFSRDLIRYFHTRERRRMPA